MVHSGKRRKGKSDEKTRVYKCNRVRDIFKLLTINNMLRTVRKERVLKTTLRYQYFTEKTMHC